MMICRPRLFALILLVPSVIGFGVIVDPLGGALPVYGTNGALTL